MDVSLLSNRYLVQVLGESDVVKIKDDYIVIVAQRYLQI